MVRIQSGPEQMGGNKKPLILQVSFITPLGLLRVADFAPNVHLAQEETEA